MVSLDTKVRDWLMAARPGLIVSSRPDEVLAAAHARFLASTDTACAIEDFESALWRCGFKLTCDERGCRLALPERSVGARV